MSRLEEVVFPRRLHRFGYFIRIVIVDACLWLLLNPVSPKDATLGGLQLVAIFLGSFVIGIYTLFFALLPRVRDAGWNSWLVILGLFPYVCLLFQLLVLFIPPKRGAVDESV